MKAKKRDSRKIADAQVARQRKNPEFWLFALGLAAALFVVLEVYGPALHGPFLFDDPYLPMNVPSIRNAPLGHWIDGVRPLLMLSYWANFQLSGSDTAQYHEWNVLIHFLNAAMIYFIVRKLLQFADGPPPLALFGAGIFLLHPIQTEAVAYITGRSEVLSAFFFLAAFTLFLYRRSPEISWASAAGVLLLFLAAMATKENTVVFPALLALTDYFWNPGFSFEGLRKNWRLYLPMLLSGIAGAVGVFRILGEADSAGFQMKGIAWYEYLFTQFRVLFVYLRLFLFPAGQTIDYDFPLSRSVMDKGAIFGLLGIVALLVAAIYFRRRYPLACYGFLTFAIILAPTSSIIPIRDPIAEHRMYLPMMGLALIPIEFVRRVPVRKMVLAAGLGAALLVLTGATYQRGKVWSGAIPLWEDAVKKSPRQARAHFQLAYAYFAENRCQEADQHYRTVAQLEKPAYDLLLDWALVDNCLNRNEEALKKLQQAAALEKTAHVYTQIAMIYAKAGKRDQSFEALRTAQSIDPGFDGIYLYRGHLFETENHLPEAEREYQRALEVNPRNQQALVALEQIHIQQRLRR